MVSYSVAIVELRPILAHFIKDFQYPYFFSLGTLHKP